MANRTRPIIDDSNGNVGISTLAAPTSKLQVGGNIVPDLNVSYSLGLPNAQWSSSYIYNQVATQATASVFKSTFAGITYISASGITASVRQFNSASNPPYVEGAMFYDWAEHSLAFYDDNNQVTHNVGQENLVRVFNPSVGALPTGMPVYISTSNASGVPQVYPAVADSLGVKYNVAGVTNHYFSGSGYGYITTVGVVHGTTQSYAAGTFLWLSQFGSGSYMTTPPTSYFEKFLVGYVIASGSVAGTDILVLPNPHVYGASSASVAISSSRAEFSQQASSSLALVIGSQYFATYMSASAGSFSGSFRGYLSGSATSASYIATCSVAILSYASQTSDFALDSMFAYSASHADTCSVFITNYLTSSQDSSSFASSSISASYTPTGRSVVLCAAYTPILTGPDAAEYVIPYSPSGDGTVPITWNIKRFVFRAQTAETVQSVVNIEKSVVTGIFTPIIVGSITLPAAAYEAYSGSTPFTLDSGDKLRFNVTTLGMAQNWTIITEISNA